MRFATVAAIMSFVPMPVYCIPILFKFLESQLICCIYLVYLVLFIMSFLVQRYSELISLLIIIFTHILCLDFQDLLHWTVSHMMNLCLGSNFPLHWTMMDLDLDCNLGLLLCQIIQILRSHFWTFHEYYASPS